MERELQANELRTMVKRAVVNYSIYDSDYDYLQTDSNGVDHICEEIAEELYNAGYRKIDKKQEDELGLCRGGKGEMTGKEILEKALSWYMGMYGCNPKKNAYDGYAEYSCNGYVTNEDEAIAILKAKRMLDWWE